MNILALDPAASTGFAYSDGTYGTVLLTNSRDTRPGDRLVRFYEWLQTAIDTHDVTLIASEDASFGSRNPNVQALHNELRGMISFVAAAREIELKLFHPSTIKAFATGSGKATKGQMVRACKTFYGLDVTDDEADAIFIMELAKKKDCWPKPKPTKAAVRKMRKKEPRLF